MSSSPSPPCRPSSSSTSLSYAPPEDEDEEDTGEERLPSCFDYVMHFLTVFWKVLFACVPPTDYLNGWACFIVSIVIIGLLTAVIGDLASHFGCTIGLKDSVTAVVFVALGTSIPGETGRKGQEFILPGIPGVPGSGLRVLQSRFSGLPDTLHHFPHDSSVCPVGRKTRLDFGT